MSEEREITIKIVGKNLTPEAFDAARRSLAGFKKDADDAGKSGESFGQKILGAKSATDLFGGTIKNFVAGFTIANLIDRATSSLIEFGKSAIDNAGHLVDLSNKTGVSLEGLQRMQFVAKQTGTTVDSFTDAIFKLGINVQKGGDETRAAVDKMGVSWAQFKALKPEDQF